MAPRYPANRKRRGGSSGDTSSTRRPQHRSNSSTAPTPVPRAVGVQRALPPVSRVGPSRQSGSQAQLPFRYDRSSSVAPSWAGAQSRSDRAATPDDDGDDAINEVVMAFDLKGRGTVGCAYYVAAEEKLYFMEDVKLGGVDIVEARKSITSLR